MRLALFSLVVVMSAGGAVAQTTAQTTPPPDPLAVKRIPPHVQAEETAALRTRIEQAGYTEVADLSRDTTGIWHGWARKGDDAVEIVVDKGGRIKATRR